MKFEFEIKEVLSRRVEVEADSAEEAKEKLLYQYKKSEIVLDDSDYSGQPIIKEVTK